MINKFDIGEFGRRVRTGTKETDFTLFRINSQGNSEYVADVGYRIEKGSDDKDSGMGVIMFKDACFSLFYKDGIPYKGMGQYQFFELGYSPERTGNEAAETGAEGVSLEERLGLVDEGLWSVFGERINNEARNCFGDLKGNGFYMYSAFNDS